MITFWRKRWYFSRRAAMVIGVPVRDGALVLPASEGEPGMWDALELAEDRTSTTIRSDTARHSRFGTSRVLQF